MELPRVARTALRTALLAALLAAPLVRAPVASGAASGSGATTTPVLDADPVTPPPGYALDATQARLIAASSPVIIAERHRHPALRPYVYTRGPAGWQVSWFEPGVSGRELAVVYVSDRTRRVTEAWTGFQVAWQMARGYPGAFGSHLTAWYIWIGLGILFAAAFLPRRLRDTGLVQLDAAALLSFSISLACFSHARIGLSVPLAVPPLLYLFVRMALLAGGRGRRRPTFLLGPRFLLVGLVFLLGFRVALNAADANVIDVGYAGVTGADRLLRGQPLYGGWPASIRSGDTYGPVNYEAYVPFRMLAGFHGRWDDLPAAHVASTVFDLLTVAGLFWLGRLIRGPDVGIRLAYLWAAFPFTTMALESDSNDSLVALLIVAALLLIHRAAGRGAASALAGLTKFAPLALGPLFWRGLDDRVRGRSLAGYASAFAATAAAVMLPVLLAGGHELRAFWIHTIGYQDERGSPFSIWGLWGGLGFEQRLVQGAAVGLAVAGFWLPRRRTVGGVCAMGAAILIAVQLGLTHWFYLYLPWFLPLVLVALEPDPVSSPPPAAAPTRSSPHASTPRLG